MLGCIVLNILKYHSFYHPTPSNVQGGTPHQNEVFKLLEGAGSPNFKEVYFYLSDSVPARVEVILSLISLAGRKKLDIFASLFKIGILQFNMAYPFSRQRQIFLLENLLPDKQQQKSLKLKLVGKNKPISSTRCAKKEKIRKTTS